MGNETSGTVKTHGFALGDRFNFHGMGRDLPTAEGTEVIFYGMVGTKHQIATVAEPIMTWEFGASAKIWASPAPVEVQATPVAQATTVADIDGADVEAVKDAEWEAFFSRMAIEAARPVREIGTEIRPVTDADMRAQVAQALGSDVAGFDVPWIVDRIQSRFGTVDIDSVPAEDFWDIVRVHGSRDLLKGSEIIARVSPVAKVVDDAKRYVSAKTKVTDPWDAMEAEIWAGMTRFVMRRPVRTNYNRRVRKAANRLMKAARMQAAR